jgi:hypothetical protein
MSDREIISRRQALRSLGGGITFAGLAACALHDAFAAEGTLLNPADAAAKAVHYVEDAKSAKGAASGSTCANCALYLGASGTAQGPCQIFPGKQVKAAGWCSSWAPQM